MSPLKNPLSLVKKRNLTVAEIRLQSCEEANIFFSDALPYKDNDLTFGDFASAAFADNGQFALLGKGEESVVEVDAETTIVEGVLTDKAGELIGTDLDYEVTICLWLSQEKKGGAS